MAKLFGNKSLCVVALLLLMHGAWLIYTLVQPPVALPGPEVGLPASSPSTAEKTPKSIVLLVPGFATRAILLPSDDDKGFTCSPQPIPATSSRDEVEYFYDLPKWLKEDGGFEVQIATLENNRTSTPSTFINAECLRKQILIAADQSPTNDVVIIAHSMGGLAARAYIQSDTFRQDSASRGQPPVSKVFLIAVPNQGMPFHFWLNLILNCESPQTTQRSACEFSSTAWTAEFNQKYHQIFEGVDFYTVGGTKHNGWLGFFAGCYICLISGPNDGTIPVSSSLGLEGARGEAVYAETHLPAVGEPSYFTEYQGQRSQAYTRCIYPVLVQGELDGCQGDAPLVCPALIGLIIVLSEFCVVMLILTLYVKQKRRGSKKG